MGKIARQIQTPPTEISTTLRDAILERWIEERQAIVPTLKPQDEVWREFWLYASIAHKWCPRMSALACALAQEGEVDPIKAELLWLFEQGHAYHDLMQQKMLSSLPEGVLRGSWERTVKAQVGTNLVHEERNPEVRAPSGIEVVRGWMSRPEGDGWRYVEPKVRLLKERIVVKVDGILAWPEEPIEVLEIKTEKLEARDSLNPKLGGKPRPQHILQTNLGMFATGLDRGRIVYIFKGAESLKNGMIEHVIERDDDLIADARRTALKCVEAVQTVEAARDGGMALEELLESVDEGYERLPECPMKSKGRARFCDGRDACFPKGYRKKK